MKILANVLWLAALPLAFHGKSCGAFLIGPPGRGGGRGGGGGRNGIVPPRAANNQPDWGGHGGNNEHSSNLVLATGMNEDEYEECDEYDDNSEEQGDGKTTSTNNIRGGAKNKIVKGTKSTLESTASYWSNAFDNAGKAVTKPFKEGVSKAASLFESKDKKVEKELMEKLQTIKIQSVIVPNTTVVPLEVVQLAARRSGLIGNPLRTDRVQEFAASLKRWYQMRGYVLHTVTGATLKTDSATAVIQVQEPQISHQPVDITFCKEMVVDEETGNLLTFRQYKTKHMKRRTIGHKGITKSDTNTTFIETEGKTRPSRIAYALGLQPGAPFRWDASRWSNIATSSVFGRIIQAGPKRMQDGTVQLQILATEAPPRHLEYGVTKSLYTGSWEGEVDFQHENLLGGGEKLGLMVRRGTKDPEPSVHVTFSDDKFGMSGGYDVEAFRDYIGDKTEGDSKAKVGEQTGGEEGATEKVAAKPRDPNSLLDRRGVKFTYRNPIGTKTIRHSRASTSLERTATQSGIREAIGSGTLALGPFRRQLPLEARSSFDGSLTSGVRIPEGSSHISEDDLSASYSGLALLPYTCFTVTTTQILPLLVSSVTPKRQPSLALRHSLTGSTRNLPRHDQNAMGFSSMIRGGTPNGRISTALMGSTELRIPLELDIPVLKNIQDNASLVLFGDWVSTRKNNGSSFSIEKSIGVGVRKVAQGIPLKVDFSYAGNGKIKSSFGLGRDFDV